MNSWYNGLQMSFMRRMARGLQFQISYTYSKALSQAETSQSAGPYTDQGTTFYAHSPSVNRGLGAIDVPQLLVTNYVYQLPFGEGKPWLSGGGLATRILGNWELKGIVTLKDGQPFSVAVDAPGGALGALMSGKRPNAIAGVSPKTYGGPDEADRYFNPADFAFPSDARAIGNLGRHTMRGPGIATWDVSATKDVSITERVGMQFRAEGFNILNNANFNNPATSAYTNAGVLRPDAGNITETTTKPREIQFGLKLTF
jgi:hypothetical protein